MTQTDVVIVGAANAGLVAEPAGKLGVPASAPADTAETFDRAVAAGAATRFDPMRLDGLSAEPPGRPPKSNWAQTLDKPPFIAYAVTFASGGLKIDNQARVVDTTGRPMPGLYATGEIAGDCFHHNYAAGAGLVRGVAFGRIAGSNAAARAAGGAG
ncbi:FAD-binding protein [Nonomuraea sp. NPDC049709]|uniref:FAD-binding protein n=1 Tax=Nonomuraea sp. NPDC049709 TaxID=3154736 RepID=UPI0034446CC4